jgi:CDP-diacylglycerol--glycerol-3-phosphate 3-phosphatidyltransferase
MDKTTNLQLKVDAIIDKKFLWIFPNWVRPNYLTYFRIGTIPIIYALMHVGSYTLALLLFVASAVTDLFDGSMARRRNQVTDLGKIIDPIADKMLIAVVLFSLGFQYLIVKIFLLFIIAEIFMVFMGGVLSYRFGRPIGANIYGKVKMVLQSISILTFLIGVIVSKNILIDISVIILFIALIFAGLAGIEVYRAKHKSIMTGIINILSNKKPR